MPLNRSSLSIALLVLLTGVCAITAGWTGLYLYLSPNLPPVESLRDIKFQTPLRIYSADNQLIGEFGEIRRIPVTFDETPPLLIKAFLAAEDDRFYSHNGVDVRGLLRSVSRLVQTGERQGGGSTITMQVAKNSFPINDGSFIYKAKQIILAIKIENELNKNEIFELYVNQNFLGNRAEGIGAAAQVYYGKPIGELTLSQYAMIAGLPKAPSSLNPLVNPERARERRDWILSRMRSLDFITEPEYQDAITTPLSARYHGQQIDLSAPFVAEMVRKYMIDIYGDRTYGEGYKVYTTVDSGLQRDAQNAVINGLQAYTERHGFYGPEQNFPASLIPIESIDATEPSPPEYYALRENPAQSSGEQTIREKPPGEEGASSQNKVIGYINLAPWQNELANVQTYGWLQPAIVVDASGQAIKLLLKNKQLIDLPWNNGPSNARPYLSEDSRGARPKSAEEFLSRGDLIRVRETEPGQWFLGQLPRAQASVVSLNPDDGAIKALVGGFDFSYSNYNRATQAKRQPGSNFKPFIYAAALENGFTAATIVNDAPIVKFDSTLEKAWRPENSGGKYSGPIRLREGLYRSKNYVAIRVLDAMGFTQTIRDMDRFGFEKSELPRDLTLALGSHVLTPLQVARGYTVFANGGYKVEPYFVQRIETAEGEVLFEATPATVCHECEDREDTTDRDTNSAATPQENSVATATNNGQALTTNFASTEAEIAAELAVELAALSVVDGNLVSNEPKKELPVAPRVMDARVAYIMDDILKDVIQRGTGTRARALNRRDIAGKTGTVGSDVNNFDAWFSGYNQHIVTTAWIGFDQNLPLGNGEYGATAALPIWMEFMRSALKDIPEEVRQQPRGLVTVRINSKTGLRAQPNDPDATFEIFREENVPEFGSASDALVPSTNSGDVHPDELF